MSKVKVGLALHAIGLLSLVAALSYRFIDVRDASAAASCGAVNQNSWLIGTASHISGEGLKLTSVQYKAQRVVAEASTPIIRVHYYSGLVIPDNLSDAVFTGNCVKTNIGTTGFKLVTTYVFGVFPGNGSYKYEDTYVFYNDGSAYHYLVIYGPGFFVNGNTAVYYQVYLRHDYDATTSVNNTSTYESTGWLDRTTEGNYPYQSPFLSGGFDWRHYVPGKQISEAPYGTTSTPDNYVLRVKNGSSEDDGDGSSLGSWANGESINSSDSVSWPISYAFTSPSSCQPSFPCQSGTRFVAAGY